MYDLPAMQANGGPAVAGPPLALRQVQIRGLLGRDVEVDGCRRSSRFRLHNVVAPHDRACLVPQGQAGRSSNRISCAWLNFLLASSGGLGCQAFLEELVELGVRVLLVVGRSVGSPDRAEEVVQRRVVTLPAGTGQARAAAGTCAGSGLQRTWRRAGFQPGCRGCS